MRITIFGAGYVGLVTGTCLAEIGHDVLVVDINEDRVKSLRQGAAPFYEPGLSDLIRRNIAAGRLCFATTATAAAEVYFIAVGTPPAADGSADVSAIHAVAGAISGLRPALVVVKSTVPVGTCDAVQAALPATFEVVSNPEFLKEGDAVSDFFRPDRIVVGARSPAAFATMRKLYAPLQIIGDMIIETDLRSSELTKYAANTMLATRVSFMNELSRLCHATGADINDVRRGVGADKRIGPRFLYAGPGYGGSCFPKDVQALIRVSNAYGVPSRIAEAAHRANEEQASFLATLVEQGVGDLAGAKIAFWGLAFKPETDDVRESPAVRLAKALIAEGASISGHDPEASANFLREVPGATVAPHEYDALDGARALVLLTEWRCYRSPRFEEMRKRMAPEAIVVDARNIWKREDAFAAGLRYRGIGQ